MKFAYNDDIYKQIAGNGFRIRGYFMNEIIVLERMVDRFLVNHFTKDEDRQLELLSLIMATKRINFESKRQVLKFIIEMHYPAFNKANPEICTDLKKLEDLSFLKKMSWGIFFYLSL